MREMILKNWSSMAVERGAFKAACIEGAEIPFDLSLRKACENNFCGSYGRNYACPPFVGEKEALIEKAASYKNALVFQTVTDIEDSYDLEGMMEAAEEHEKLALELEKEVKKQYGQTLLLTAGGCRRCKTCGAMTGEACRFPGQAVSSVEAYCIDCGKLAAKCDMSYTNGKNTVTYFGMILI